MKKSYKQIIVLLISAWFLMILTACKVTVKENDQTLSKGSKVEATTSPESQANATEKPADAAVTTPNPTESENSKPEATAGPETPAETNESDLVLLPDDKLIDEPAYTRDGQILGYVGETVYSDDNVDIVLSGWHGMDTDSGIDLTVINKTNSRIYIDLDYVKSNDNTVMAFGKTKDITFIGDSAVLRIPDKILIGYSMDLNTVNLQCVLNKFKDDGTSDNRYVFDVETILGKDRQIDMLTCYTADTSNMPETSQTEDNTLDLSGSDNVTINGLNPNDPEFDPWPALDLFIMKLDNAYVQAWDDYSRPANKNTFDVNGATIDAKTATEPKIIVDFENGDTIDGLKAGSTPEDFCKAWGPCQNLMMDKYDIMMIFRHDVNLDHLVPDQGFDGVEAKVYLKFTPDMKDMIPYKVVLEFSVG